MKKTTRRRIRKFIRFIKKNRVVVSLAAVVFVLAFCSVAVYAAKRGNKHSNQNETLQSSENGLLMEHFTIPKQTEESTTETETETEEMIVEDSPVVDEEQVEAFLEEVNSEDEEALDLSEVEPHAVCVPYDGAARSVSCWGDSMTYGVGSSSEATSFPGVLESLSGRTVYNMGGPGETSFEIAARQGAYDLYTDRDITINEESSTLVNFICDYTGDVLNFYEGEGSATDSSGYSHRAEPQNNIIGLCYFDNIPVVARYDAGSGMMAVRSCPEAKSLQLAIVDTGNRRCSTISGITNAAFVDNMNLCATIDKGDSKVSNGGAKPGETQTESESASTEAASTEPASTEPASTEAAPTEPAPTEPASTEPATTEPTKATEVFKPLEEPTTSRVLTDISIPEGASVRTRAAIDRAGDILVLEIGSNGGWESNYQVLINQYNRMIDSANCDYFIIIGDTDDPGTSVGDDNQTQYDDYGDYVGIGDTAWEATLREAYGDHFVNMRVELIKNGLNYAGLDTTEDDLNGYVIGRISKRLRTDWTHLNNNGYYAKGRIVYNKGVELGYWH